MSNAFLSNKITRYLRVFKHALFSEQQEHEIGTAKRSAVDRALTEIKVLKTLLDLGMYALYGDYYKNDFDQAVVTDGIFTCCETQPLLKKRLRVALLFFTTESIRITAQANPLH